MDLFSCCLLSTCDVTTQFLDLINVYAGKTNKNRARKEKQNKETESRHIAKRKQSIQKESTTICWQSFQKILKERQEKGLTFWAGVLRGRREREMGYVCVLCVIRKVEGQREQSEALSVIQIPKSQREKVIYLSPDKIIMYCVVFIHRWRPQEEIEREMCAYCAM